jgi:hypothetical protein
MFRISIFVYRDFQDSLSRKGKAQHEKTNGIFAGNIQLFFIWLILVSLSGYLPDPRFCTSDNALKRLW